MIKRLLLVLMVLVLLATPAFADIFGPTSKDLIDIGGNKSFKQRVSETQKLKLDVDSSSIVSYLASAINALGAREGFGYDWKDGGIVNVSGATVASKWNCSLNLDIYNVDGGGIGLSYNLGAILSDDIAIKKYMSYCHIGASYGKRYYDDKWNDAIVAPEFQVKFTF